MEYVLNSLSLDDIYPNEYYIVDIEGNIYYPEEYDYKDEYFKALVDHEVFKKEVKRKKSPHIDLMKKLKLAEHEPYTDSGHLTYLPKGALVLDLLADRSLQVVLALGAMPVKSSILYDLNIDAIKEHAKLFGQRMYKVKSEKRTFVLRYAACFGQFSLLKRHYLTYRDLPLRIFELADSYRYEQRGEISGLARVRRFYMPDLHVLLKDLDEAKKEFLSLYKLIFSEAERFGWTYYSLYNIDPSFLRNEWNFVLELVKFEGKPVLLHTVEEGKYYWRINVEFTYIDSQMRPLETATIQIDTGNAERFDITYIDKDSTKKYPVIIHTAIHGSLERFLFEFLEEAAKMQIRGEKPQLPVWLSPVQVRIIPVSEKHLSFAIDVAKKIAEAMIRVDVDDRALTVSKKVMEAEREWIPYIVIIGEKEIEKGKLTVRIRKTGEIRHLEINKLIDIIDTEIGDMPRRPLYFPMFMSRRPEIT